jgi:photosystem II stability/assembly factor-like uncharacterized protein
MAWVQPTTPAKQSRMSMEWVEAAVAKAAVTAGASVTSTGVQVILAEGKSVMRDWIAGSEVVKVVRRSKSVRLDRPCSRSARAAARARVPAPPVTS